MEAGGCPAGGQMTFEYDWFHDFVAGLAGDLVRLSVDVFVNPQNLIALPELSNFT